MATYSLTMATPVGILKLTSDEQNLKSISFDAEYAQDDLPVPEILVSAREQLEAYFAGNLQKFDLKTDPEGTDFQRKVWEQVSAVNFGDTMSYVEISRAVGSDDSSRAVGMANGRNPLPIVVPCHRIIGHNGKLTGYAGGLERKKWLLLHELKISGKGGLF